MCMVAHIQVPCGQEGVIKPLGSTRTGVPKHIVVARTLAKVGHQHDMVLQVANASPTPKTVYKGTKLGTFAPISQVHPINVVQEGPYGHWVNTTKINIDLARTDLSPIVNSSSYSTCLPHSAQSSPLPMIRWQPLRRLPQAMTPVVEWEVQKMLEQGVILHSTSPWYSGVVMHGSQERWVLEILRGL